MAATSSRTRGSTARAYVALAVVAAFGPYALLVAAGPDASFHLAGFLVGAALLVTAWYVKRASERRAAASMTAAS